MRNTHRYWNLERILLLLCVVVGIAMFFASVDYPLAARRFPQLISGGVAFLAGYLLIMQAIARFRGTEVAVVEEEDSDPTTKNMPSWMGLGMAAIFLVVAYGFGLGTAILAFVTTVSRRLGLSWPKAIVFGAAFALLIWYAFGILLNVPLPTGMVIHLF